MSAARKKTLEDILADQVKAFVASDRPAEIIGASVERLFAEVVRDAFSPSGEFAASLKGVLAKALPANLSEVIQLPAYNDLLVTALKERWARSGATGDFLARAYAAIDELMSNNTIPEFVSLRELLEAFVDAHQAKAADRGWFIPHVTISESDGVGGRARYLHVFFDPEPEMSFRDRNRLFERPRGEMEYANRISLRVTGHTDRGHEYGEVYAAMLEGEPIGRHFAMTGQWQRLVGALYFGAAKLVIDCGEDDFTYDTE